MSLNNYQCSWVSQPHEKTALAGMLPQHVAVVLSGNKVYKDILTVGVKGPIDFPP